jgi:hypothetical protein
MMLHFWQPIPVNTLQRVKKWHVEHKNNHPLELHVLDAVLTLWVMSLVGWLPLLILDLAWLLPVCLLGALLPSVYICWRMKAHEQRRLRCDWLSLLA